jgi:carbonic anhydrase
MSEAKFVTVVTCMDGRVQEPVAKWMRETFQAEYVDTITEPGPDAILVDGPDEIISAIRRRVDISVKAHGSSVVAIVAHHDCAGNPVSHHEHLAQLNKAVRRLEMWEIGARLLTLWVDDKWQVQKIYDSQE